MFVQADGNIDEVVQLEAEQDSLGQMKAIKQKELNLLNLDVTL